MLVTILMVLIYPILVAMALIMAAQEHYRLRALAVAAVAAPVLIMALLLLVKVRVAQVVTLVPVVSVEMYLEMAQPDHLLMLMEVLGRAAEEERVDRLAFLMVVQGEEGEAEETPEIPVILGTPEVPEQMRPITVFL